MTASRLERRLQNLAFAALLLALFTIWHHEQNYIPPDDLKIDYPIESATSSLVDDVRMNESKLHHGRKLPANPLFYMIPTPELNTWITGNYTSEASRIYANALNEARAEIWLHRAFDEQMSQFRTLDPAKADVFVIAGYFHLRERLLKQNLLRPEHVLPKNDWIDDFLGNRIIDKHRPHLMLVPTWNPTVSRKIWLHPLMKAMVRRGFHVWSVGYERNPAWQSTPFERIIPIPYVVEPPWTRDQMMKQQNAKRKDNFVFYAGDSRPNAIEWAGCHRARMLSPLVNITNNMDIRIVTKYNRLSQIEYNDRMATSEYCLILCGDTPSSRSLTSAMVNGCIPVRIGSRLRGLCEPPCKVGFGFRRTGTDYPHLPFANAIDWNSFPELNEAAFTKKPYETLQEMLARVGPGEKQQLRSIMRKVQLGWIYGWGNPVNATEFGNAALFIWQSFVDALKRAV